jgi:ketosteroid isomerase-like protein
MPGPVQCRGPRTTDRSVANFQAERAVVHASSSAVRGGRVAGTAFLHAEQVPLSAGAGVYARDVTDRQAKAKRMEQVIRGYFDACNTGDAAAVAAWFAPGAVHYFPPDMYEGPFRGGETIGAKWSWAVATLGSRWTVDEVICDPDTDRAVIEWTHEKTKSGVVLRGDEWYRFDPDTGLIAEIRAYYASPQAAGLNRLELAGFPYAERGYAASG